MPKTEKKKNGAEDTADPIDAVDMELDEILENFAEDGNGEGTEKNADKTSKSIKLSAGEELEQLAKALDEDADEEAAEKEPEEKEPEEQDEYVYDSKLHWGTTNLLHSFLYHKGEKYRFSEHGTVRNWFHKKLFGSQRSQEKSRRTL
ncbi:MAG: hypothetical protein IKO05_12255, partial [Selenomonadaceae bacterium]|nr:hypothetical protein [Selenomonadaceae bacterium]